MYLIFFCNFNFDIPYINVCFKIERTQVCSVLCLINKNSILIAFKPFIIWMFVIKYKYNLIDWKILKNYTVILRNICIYTAMYLYIYHAPCITYVIH